MSNFEAFFMPSTFKTEIKKLRVGYVYIEESFVTIFNIGNGSGKSAMGERVNIRTMVRSD